MIFNFNDERDRFFWGSFWHDDNCRNLSVLNPDDVILAVNKAYIDMTPRTINGLGLSVDSVPKSYKKDYNGLVNKKIKLLNDLRQNLAKNIVNSVFKANQFKDAIHKSLCDTFKKEFEGLADKLNKDIEQANIPGLKRITTKKITYGKAQKIVNMTMKYLYFFDNANTYVNSVFNNCHMAIDEYIMVYFNKNGINRPGTSWSNFDDATYEEYQDGIKDYCNQKGEKPFFAEFKYWNQGRKIANNP